jgi:DNA-binding transcriptional regulator YhcF (GntR family)
MSRSLPIEPQSISGQPLATLPTSVKQALNPGARRVLEIAKEAAVSRGSSAIELEHVLLGLLSDSVGLAGPLLVECGVDVQALHEKLTSALPMPRPHVRARADVLPYMPSAEKVVNRAKREAVAVGSAVVGSEHILFSLLGKSGPVTRYLEDVGMTYDRARVQLQTLRWLRPVQIHFLRLKTDSGTPVARQIEDQFREAVACGRLHVGDLLPAARQIAKQLGVGRATIDRALRKLIKSGLLLSEGKGIRVAEPQIEEMPESERKLALYKMLRGVVVSAFHLGASADELEKELKSAMRGVFVEVESDT